MVNIKLESEGYLIENKILFGASIPNKEYINLATEIGEDIVIEKLPYSIVEYPGEYDIDGVFIRSFGSKDGKLNYIITINNKTIGLVQSAKILEEDDVRSLDAWLYLDDAVEKKLEQLELEGKKFKLNLEDGNLRIEEKESEHAEVMIDESEDE
ncbi:MAG TPA: hypothetical protein PK674_00640 [Candidatus Absconditabacterales bacterium]|nr:hypothetical protein [Candidatus Absconditabacterales bacterium]HOQ78677.1 hypothetical protein [Candidatus Absconditabacterales bacterium]HPK28026.1 hypothetical protein [Candidatus Absconditabacterales bacterium]